MLDAGGSGHQSGTVKDSADYLRERGWAILERLQAVEADHVSPEAPVETPETSTAEEPLTQVHPAGLGPEAKNFGAGSEVTEVDPAPAAEVHPAPTAEVLGLHSLGPQDQAESTAPLSPATATTRESTAFVATPTVEAAAGPPAPAPAVDDLRAVSEGEPPQPFVRALPRVVAVANQKGGVGKTTTAVNVGAALAQLGYRVLVVDLDPQGNATTGLGINPRHLDSSIYDVIMRETPLEDCIEPTSLRNLFVAPATINLAGAEIELVPAFSRELKLRRAVEAVLDDFDFVMIDCPPSLGLLTVNGLGAASEVLVPIQCEYYALEGLGQLLRNVSLVQGHINPRLEVSAIVLTMYDARTKLAEQVAREVREHFGAKVCRNIVPRTVRLSEAPSFGQPIVVFDPTSRGAIAYREIAKEVSGGAPQRAG
jgi:chromosome partitioning protein